MFADFNNLIEFVEYFSHEAICREYLVNKRWKDGLVCVHCSGTKVYRYKDGKTLRCGSKGCLKKFRVTHGSIFEKSPIPLRKWFTAIYLYTSDTVGISSTLLAKQIGVSQKAAWFMHHRIMEAFKHDVTLVEPRPGAWEIDEVYIGANRKRISNHRKAKVKRGEAEILHTPIFAMVHRGRGIFGHVFRPGTTELDIQPIAQQYIHQMSTIYSDSNYIYAGMDKYYLSHVKFNHTDGDYGEGGEAHSNTVEGAFKHFRDRIRGRYKQLGYKYLQRYWDEFCFRYNHTKLSDNERFDLIFATINRRLTYKQLVNGKEEGKESGGEEGGARESNENQLDFLMRL